MNGPTIQQGQNTIVDKFINKDYLLISKDIIKTMEANENGRNINQSIK